MTNEKGKAVTRNWKRFIVGEIALAVLISTNIDRDYCLNSKMYEGLPSPTQEELIQAIAKRDLRILENQNYGGRQ